jgi:[ribosomal protein S18]-alanine N-acetyltransferase
MVMASVRVRPMTTADATHVSSWRYPDRWSVYDLQSSTDILDELDLYKAVSDGDGTLIGFFCQESAARVRGMDPDPEILDVGVGMDPRLVGQGSGRAFGEVVLDHLGRNYPGRPLRAVIQSWNVRSRRFAATLGFADVGELTSSQVSQHDSYRILLKPEAGSSRGFVVAPSGIWLFGDRLMLREFVAEDQHAVHAYASDPAVTRFTDWGPNSIAETHAFLAGVVAQRGDDETEFVKSNETVLIS